MKIPHIKYVVLFWEEYSDGRKVIEQYERDTEVAIMAFAKELWDDGNKIFAIMQIDCLTGTSVVLKDGVAIEKFFKAEEASIEQYKNTLSDRDDSAFTRMFSGMKGTA